MKMGVKPVMVTGDNWRTARAVAKEVGITDVRAEVMPAGKADVICSLHKRGSVVAMVGDGINDSPALAAADVGMAIGAGTEIAIEAADYVLTKSSLDDVITAIDLSRKTFSLIRFYYFIAMGIYNVIAIPVAAGVPFPWLKLMLPPWVAGACMAFSAVNVACSSLLLRRYKKTYTYNYTGDHCRVEIRMIEETKKCMSGVSLLDRVTQRARARRYPSFCLFSPSPVFCFSHCILSSTCLLNCKWSATPYFSPGNLFSLFQLEHIDCCCLRNE
ncbi:cation-transporting ATPase HMA5-like [Primulina tabacum]|uniref:cation-transporting ATPase HMA5-like n=1 Tax=Primulina tabacum TaxID=48773 RepID=UPI003F5A2FBA